MLAAAPVFCSACHRHREPGRGDLRLGLVDVLADDRRHLGVRRALEVGRRRRPEEGVRLALLERLHRGEPGARPAPTHRTPRCRPCASSVEQVRIGSRQIDCGRGSESQMITEALISGVKPEVRRRLVFLGGAGLAGRGPGPAGGRRGSRAAVPSPVRSPSMATARVRASSAGTACSHGRLVPGDELAVAVGDGVDRRRRAPLAVGVQGGADVGQLQRADRRHAEGERGHLLRGDLGGVVRAGAGERRVDRRRRPTSSPATRAGPPSRRPSAGRPGPPARRTRCSVTWPAPARGSSTPDSCRRCLNDRGRDQRAVYSAGTSIGRVGAQPHLHRRGGGEDLERRARRPAARTWWAAAARSRPWLASSP